MKYIITFLLLLTALLAIIKIWVPISWAVVTMPVWLTAVFGCIWMASSIRMSRYDKRYPVNNDLSDWGEKMEAARRNEKR